MREQKFQKLFDDAAKLILKNTDPAATSQWMYVSQGKFVIKATPVTDKDDVVVQRFSAMSMRQGLRGVEWTQLQTKIIKLIEGKIL